MQEKIESNFAVNYLSHYVLVMMLLGCLDRDARVSFAFQSLLSGITRLGLED